LEEIQLGNLLKPKLTGHVPRHTLANHNSYMGNSEEEIRKVLDQSNTITRKIYPRKRSGFLRSKDLTKRFHQIKK